MPRDDVPPRFSVQQLGVEPAAQADPSQRVVGQVPRRQLFEEPDALLAERQREIATRGNSLIVCAPGSACAPPAGAAPVPDARLAIASVR